MYVSRDSLRLGFLDALELIVKADKASAELTPLTPRLLPCCGTDMFDGQEESSPERARPYREDGGEGDKRHNSGASKIPEMRVYFLIPLNPSFVLVEKIGRSIIPTSCLCNDVIESLATCFVSSNRIQCMQEQMLKLSLDTKILFSS